MRSAKLVVGDISHPFLSRQGQNIFLLSVGKVLKVPLLACWLLSCRVLLNLVSKDDKNLVLNISIVSVFKNQVSYSDFGGEAQSEMCRQKWAMGSLISCPISLAAAGVKIFSLFLNQILGY